MTTIFLIRLWNPSAWFLGAGTVVLRRCVSSWSGRATCRRVSDGPLDWGLPFLNPPLVTDPWIDRSLLTTDAADLATRADIVVELMGGIEAGPRFLLAAINAGASVVTANKALLATHGPELYKAAADKGVDIYFEAAVAGAIPIVRPLRESLVGDKVNRVPGIVNGTTNYILDEMTTKGLSFDAALKDAQSKGFAEADPTADVDGLDAAAKAAIIANCRSIPTAH